MSCAMRSIFSARTLVCFSWFSGAYEMLPVSASFSMPPMRCSRPGVPGMTHARASVFGSRSYTKFVFGSGRCVALEGGRAAEVRQLPRLRAVRDVAVAEQHHGHHVARRDLHGL